MSSNSSVTDPGRSIYTSVTVQSWVESLEQLRRNPPAHIVRPVLYRIHIAGAIGVLEYALRIWARAHKWGLNPGGAMLVAYLDDISFQLVRESMSKASFCAFHPKQGHEDIASSGTIYAAEPVEEDELPPENAVNS